MLRHIDTTLVHVPAGRTSSEEGCRGLVHSGRRIRQDSPIVTSRPMHSHRDGNILEGYGLESIHPIGFWSGSDTYPAYETTNPTSRSWYSALCPKEIWPTRSVS